MTKTYKLIETTVPSRAQAWQELKKAGIELAARLADRAFRLVSQIRDISGQRATGWVEMSGSIRAFVGYDEVEVYGRPGRGLWERISGNKDYWRFRLSEAREVVEELNRMVELSDEALYQRLEEALLPD